MTAERTSINHRPGRPSWKCGVDDDEWPCELARKEITEQYHGDRGGLTAHLVFLMRRASDEVHPADPTKPYRRFVAWTLDREAACRACGKAGHDLLPGLPPRFIPCDGKGVVIPPAQPPMRT